MYNPVQSISDDIARVSKVFGKGVPTGVIRRICNEHSKKINMEDSKVVDEICEKLLQTREWEKRTVAFALAFKFGEYQKSDYYKFYRWLNEYVKDWGGCDDLCTHAYGLFIYKYPEFLKEVKTWVAACKWWVRRAAAVVAIYSIRRNQLIREALDIADLLLTDEHDLVRKGYGWLLKEVSNKDPELIYEFVLARKAFMPRVSLRYAIEKLPVKLRKEAMKK